jgi:flagellar motor switch protein FliM
VADDAAPRARGGEAPSPERLGGRDDYDTDWEIFADAPAPARERLLGREEIERLLGAPEPRQSGVGAVLGAGAVSPNLSPMFELAFDRLARRMSETLRGFTGDTIEAALGAITQVRIGDYLGAVPQPSILAVFRSPDLGWAGLLTIEPNLIYAVLDVLLGGRHCGPPMRIEGRPTTAIERNLVQRLIELVLEDCGRAFGGEPPVRFLLERIETNPRLAAVDRAGASALLATMRIEMEDRGGQLAILFPRAALGPLGERLEQPAAPDAPGRSGGWDRRLAGQVRSARVGVRAVLGERRLRLSEVLALKVGDTVMLDAAPDGLVALKAGAAALAVGRLGRRNQHFAIRLAAAPKADGHGL